MTGRCGSVAAERRRFGYRRLGYLLAREGIVPNHKKLLRIYREDVSDAWREHCACAAVAGGNGRWARADRWCCRTARTNAGRSTSSLTA
jgi:hypothetical protein